MVAKNILKAFGVFAFRFICKKVDLLIKRHGFPKRDREELLQSFALNLHARSANFNPQVASWEAFVVVVCENHVADLIEHRFAEMRTPLREGGSLDAPSQADDGRRCDWSSQLAESQHGRRTGRRTRSDRELFEMHSDVEGVISGLPDLQRRISRALMRHGCVSAAARELDLPRSLVTKEMVCILERFERTNLRKYL